MLLQGFSAFAYIYKNVSIHRQQTDLENNGKLKQNYFRKLHILSLNSTISELCLHYNSFKMLGMCILPLCGCLVLVHKRNIGHSLKKIKRGIH